MDPFSSTFLQTIMEKWRKPRLDFSELGEVFEVLLRLLDLVEEAADAELGEGACLFRESSCCC